MHGKSIELLKRLTFISMTLIGCNNVEIPKEQYYQFYTGAEVYFKDDTVNVYLNNPVSCPLRYYVSSSDPAVDRSLNNFKPITLKEKKDTVLKIAVDSSAIRTITYFNVLGDLSQKVAINKISLPFPKGRTYKVIQSYQGKYSHDIDNYSRYSIDFNLKTNDTICAADEGIVVGVIEDYKYGGDDQRFRPHVNLITLFHPHSGLFTQYLHLKYKGSLVKLDDSIARGEPIGMSGETGFTDVEHLHFCALVPTDGQYGLNSVKTTFIEGYEGEQLRKGDRVKK